MQDYAAAVSDLEALIALTPGRSDGYELRALALRSQGRFADAIADAKKALQIDPSSKDAKEILALTEKMAAEAAQGPRPAPSQSASPSTSDPQLATMLALVGDVLQRVRASYVVKPDDRALVEGAIVGFARLNAQIAQDPVVRSALDALKPGSAGGAAKTPNELFSIFAAAFGDARRRIEGRIADEVLTEAVLTGMLAALDGYSDYISPKRLAQLEAPTPKDMVELGVELMMDNGLPRVITAFDRTTAAGPSGLLANDIITHHGSTPLLGETLYRVVLDGLRGADGAMVSLKISRKGLDKPLDLMLPLRKPIDDAPVACWLGYDGAITYIRVRRFSASVQKELTEQARSMKGCRNGSKGFIIDVRNNPGGVFDEALALADEFLDRGDIIARFSRDPPETRRWEARPGDVAVGKKVVVLINAGTSGAAEIVAAALQDRKRAVVLGTRSFGRASFQAFVRLGQNGQHGAMRLTTADYVRASGRPIRGHGVEPDKIVKQKVPRELEASREAAELAYMPQLDPLNDTQLQAAIELLNAN